jgi:uncharacterized protein
MPIPIIIAVRGLALRAELNDSAAAQAVAAALPITGEVNRWGEEVYFEIPVAADLAPDARADVAIGELGYWPPGRAFCIFFGRTPASTGPEPRAASAVNIIGKMTDDARRLRETREGDKIFIRGGS